MISPIFLNRQERKFEVRMSTAELPALLERIERYLPAHEYIPGQLLTHNHTFYFDNDDCHLLRQGLVNRYEHLRVRARRYEYDAPVGDGRYWLELKRRTGDARRKSRLTLSPDDLTRLVAGVAMTDDIRAGNPQLANGDCESLYRELQSVIETHELKPLLLVSYQRAAFENETERLSIDWDIRYRRASWPMLGAPSLKDLPRAADGSEWAIVMELKYTGELPDWLAALEWEFPILPRELFSKCDRGMRTLLRGPLQGHRDALDLLGLMDSCKHDSAHAA